MTLLQAKTVADSATSGSLSQGRLASYICAALHLWLLSLIRCLPVDISKEQTECFQWEQLLPVELQQLHSLLCCPFNEGVLLLPIFLLCRVVLIF